MIDFGEPKVCRVVIQLRSLKSKAEMKVMTAHSSMSFVSLHCHVINSAGEHLNSKKYLQAENNKANCLYK